MLKSICFAIISAAVLLSCTNSGNNAASAAGAPEAAGNIAGNNTAGDNFYFTYTVDGKEMQVSADDISADYRTSYTDTVFHLYAGKEGGPRLLLTVPYDMAKPSATPSGSADNKLHIQQGSLSLTDYPEKGYTTNSYNGTYPEKSPLITDAIVISGSKKEGDVARIISGTFHATTYGEASGTDPKSSNHQVAGRFKIRHQFSATNGDKF